MSIHIDTTYADQMVELLEKASQGRYTGVPKIRGWRFDVSEGRSTNLKIVDNKLGGVYGPATARDSLGGGVYIIWEDDKRSNASIDRRTIEEFEENLKIWRASAFSDERAPEILEPQPIPEVHLFSPEILELIDGKTDIFFEILKQGDSDLRKGGVEFVDAGAGASYGVRYLRNSKGLNVHYPATYFSFSFSADSIYGNGYSKRKMPPEGEVERIIKDVKETTALLKQTGKFTPDPKGTRVLLEMGVADSFMGNYVAGNLSGSAVANKQSAFQLEDFETAKQVVRQDISLFIDGLRDFESSASRLTSEGIAGGQGYLIQNGKLVTPYLDLKYAGITGFKPTPAGGRYTLVEGERKEFAQMIKDTNSGLLVYGVLGMHTQDTTSGRFSLSAPRTLVIEDGELKGKVKVTISGNFFDLINSPETAFAWDENEDDPAIALTCNVIVEE
jgi:PmbA protein